MDGTMAHKSTDRRPMDGRTDGHWMDGPTDGQILLWTREDEELGMVGEEEGKMGDRDEKMSICIE